MRREARGLFVLLVISVLSALSADLPFAWDYPPTAPPASYLLLWGTNAVATTNTSATASNVLQGEYDFRAAATNASGGATGPVLRVRVVKVTIEQAGAVGGPWAVDTLLFRSYTLGPTNGFLRVRMDW